MSWKLYEGNCFDYLPLIEDKSIDMILCDLPYGTTACKWDTPLPLGELWHEYKRIIKDNGAIVLTASQPFTSKLVSSNYEMFRYSWVWNKGLVTGFLDAKKRPLKQHEDILLFYNQQPTYNPIKWVTNKPLRMGLRASAPSENYGKYKPLTWEDDGTRYPTSIIYFQKGANNAYKKDLVHPTQKPVALFEYLIKTYTNEQDLVLDNCAGSGTTGVACENLNRNSILMEQEPDYCQIIKDRMATAHELKLEQRKQTSLNAFSGQQTLGMVGK